MTANLIQGALFGETPAEPAVTLKSIAERYGVEYSPVWLSPVCAVTPRRWRNHTGCDYTLCTCGCHHRVRDTTEAAVTAGEEKS